MSELVTVRTDVPPPGMAARAALWTVRLRALRMDNVDNNVVFYGDDGEEVFRLARKHFFGSTWSTGPDEQPQPPGELVWPLRCIRCGVRPDLVMPDHDERQPYAATVFTSHGQYGSTVWDPSPADPAFLRVNVCDACLRAAAEAGDVARVTPMVVRTEDAVRWDPEDDDS